MTYLEINQENIFMDMYHYGESSLIPEGLSTIETIGITDRVRVFFRSGESIVISPDISCNISGENSEISL